MTSTRRLIAQAQQARAGALGKADHKVDHHEAIGRVDAVIYRQITEDERLRTELAQEREIQFGVRWRIAMRCFALVGGAGVLLVALTILVVAWLRGQTAPAVAAASAVALQFVLLVVAAVRHELLGSAGAAEEANTDQDNEGEEPPSAQLRLLPLDG